MQTPANDKTRHEVEAPRATNRQLCRAPAFLPGAGGIRRCGVGTIRALLSISTTAHELRSNLSDSKPCVLMPERPCPDCGKPGRALDVESDAVEYFRCCACGFVWTQDRDDPSAPPTAITMPPRVLRIREQ